jgi:hypothetical protein
MIGRMYVLLQGAVLFLALVISLPVAGIAGIPAPPLPPLLIPAPPPVVLIPGTYAYFAPDVDAELIFYGGFWYRPYRGGWYRASHYNGPWGFVNTKKVPGVLINLPPGYRSGPHGGQPIPHGQLKKNWKTWEQHKHWDKPGKPGKRKAGKTKKHEQSEHESGRRGHDR